MDTNRPEYNYNGYDTLSGSTGSHDLSNYNPNKPGMFRAPKMNTVINIFGVPTYLAGVLLNIDNWRGGILLFLGAMFTLFKIIRLIVFTYQDYRERNIELKAKRKRWEKDVWD